MPLPPLRLKTSMRALSHRNYRLFFAGQGLSLIGTWMTRLASSWLVYRLTDDAWMLGVVNFASLVPAFLLAPVAGVYVDSWNLKRLLVATQTIAALQSAGLAVLAIASAHLPTNATIAWLIVLNVIQGVINAFDMPGRQTLLPRMVEDRQDLPNAIALNSAMFHGARLVGPAIAGFVIAAYGEAWCFAIDALSYVAVVGALLAMHIRVDQVSATVAKMRGGLLEGWRYATGFPPIRAILLLLAVFGFMGSPYTVLLPVFAKEILGGGPHILGLLTGASGLGAVLGALRLARRESVLGLGRAIVNAGLLFAVALSVFAWSHNLTLSCLMLVASGLGNMTQMAASSTILQMVVDDDKRGRVMSLYTAAFMGTAPFGALLAGYLARVIGVSQTLFLGALCCAGASVYFWRKLPSLRPHVWPIYLRRGILKEPTILGPLPVGEDF